MKLNKKEKYITQKNVIQNKDARVTQLKIHKENKAKIFDFTQIVSPEFIRTIRKNGHYKYAKNLKVVFDPHLNEKIYGECYAECKIIHIEMSLLKARVKREYVLRHEFCHLLDYYIFGKLGHGKTWKALMKMYGLPTTAAIDLECIDTLKLVEHSLNHRRTGIKITKTK